MSKVLGLKDDTEPLVRKSCSVYTRAQLANVQINWGDASIYDVLPAKAPRTLGRQTGCGIRSL